MTLIAHDYFAIRGGGERLALELASELGAQLLFGYRTADSYGAELFPNGSVDLNLPSSLRRRGFRVPALAIAFRRQQELVAGHDIRIFSGSYAPFAAPDADSPGRNIYYCHTPPRFLYDQRDFFTAQGSPLRQFGATVLTAWFQRGYQRALSRMHLIVANSETVRSRIKRYLGHDSTVVFPPVDTDGFYWRESQGYYLSTARLSALKRVETIINAFLTMPDKTLVVASGGDEADALRARVGDAPNIRFTGWASESELRQLMAGTIATIYVPVDEDFGMSPVESMAAGKPVIGVAEGGLLETVLDGETGVLLPPRFTAVDLAHAVNCMTPALALTMRAACEQRARLFSRARFVDGMQRAIETAQAK